MVDNLASEVARTKTPEELKTQREECLSDHQVSMLTKWRQQCTRTPCSDGWYIRCDGYYNAYSGNQRVSSQAGDAPKAEMSSLTPAACSKIASSKKERQNRVDEKNGERDRGYKSGVKENQYFCDQSRDSIGTADVARFMGGTLVLNCSDQMSSAKAPQNPKARYIIASNRILGLGPQITDLAAVSKKKLEGRRKGRGGLSTAIAAYGMIKVTQVIHSP